LTASAIDNEIVSSRASPEGTPPKNGLDPWLDVPDPDIGAVRDGADDEPRFCAPAAWEPPRTKVARRNNGSAVFTVCPFLTGRVLDEKGGWQPVESTNARHGDRQNDRASSVLRPLTRRHVAAASAMRTSLTGIYTLCIKTCMSSEEYRKTLDVVTRELETLTAKRAELDVRIGQLMQTMGNLMKLCGLAPTVAFGLTDSCRMVLRSAGHPLTAVEVRGQLAAMGLDLSRYSNDLAAIHTILKRLNESGEVRFVARAWGKPGYQWTKPLHGAGDANALLPEPRETGARRKKRRTDTK
jgi:hypothetical protein